MNLWLIHNKTYFRYIAHTYLGDDYFVIRLLCSTFCRKIIPNLSQGFPFHSGGLGVEGVFARRCVYVRNRSQPSAWGCYGRAYGGESCNSGHFWRFQTSRSLVSRGRRGTLWHSNLFHNVSKVVLCGRCNIFASLWVAVFVAGAALWQPPSSFRVAGTAL